MHLLKRDEMINDTGRHYLSEYYFRIQVLEFNQNNINLFSKFFAFKEQLFIICLKGNGTLITEDNEEFILEESEQIFVTKPFKIIRQNNLILEMIWNPDLNCVLTGY